MSPSTIGSTLVRILFTAIVAWSASAALLAQSTPQNPQVTRQRNSWANSWTSVVPGGRVLSISGGTASLVVADARAEAAGKDGEKEEEAEEEKPLDPKKMQAFQQLVVDRRPSTVLAEWAKPEPQAPDEDPELALPDDPGEAPTAPTAPVQPQAPEAPPAELETRDPTAFADAQLVFELQTIAHEAAMEAFAALQAAHTAEQAQFTETKAAYDKVKAEYDQKKAEIEQKRFAREMEIFTRDLTLGRWQRVAAVLADIPSKNAEQIYTQLLTKLATPPPTKVTNNQLRAYGEKNEFDCSDILGLLGAAPGGVKKEQTALFVPLLARTFEIGHTFEEWVDALRTETSRPEEEQRVDRRTASLLLTAMNRNREMGEFLPDLETATADDDREGLNLLARHFVAEYEHELESEFLVNAWFATLAALAEGEVEDDQKTEALRRAVELAPKLGDLLGGGWLIESFTTRPERGMEILATIGKEASEGMAVQAGNTEYRIDTLRLLHESIAALLEVAPERAEEWSGQLRLLAEIWLREARHAYEFSQADTFGPRSRRDAFGNVYWTSYYGSRSHPVTALEPAQLLEVAPDGRWRELLGDSLRPEFDSQIAELYLKLNEEDRAFPYIESLAPIDEKRANELAKEFLEVWINNNDPNSSRAQRYTNIYSFQYGFNTRASGIPLTRSKQERNLRDLARVVHKLRGVEGIELDTKVLLRAFRSSHSQAEVYRIETMENVFGSLEDLDASVLADLAQEMRANLASVWRQPAVQKQAGTNRRQKDIELEVQRGYEIAQRALSRAIAAHPASWELMAARAAMIHDLNNYRNELEKNAEFTGTRRDALELFEKAAATYVATIDDSKPNEWNVTAFDFWFSAALGASDLQAVSEDTRLAAHQIPKIKEMLEDIPGEAGEQHLAKFANGVFARLSSVNPSVKKRYLTSAFDIVGDHPQAAAARKVFEYYDDLVTEIELAVTVDGAADVGTAPFGLRVDILCTKEIERESGGFAKYLQNQSSSTSYYYNYGRPLEDYRDKFEEAARTILGEQFDVLSVTFNADDTKTKAAERYGWRRMPYAYMLLQAKGPEVDRVPPLKIDLDFNEVTGYVVLPITSPVVPIDASAAAETRPFADLRLTQILDERETEDGAFGLEIKAEATGLVPDLDDLVDFSDSDFVVSDVDDQGVAVSRFGDDRDSIRSERLFRLEMKPKDGLDAASASRFVFPTATLADAENVYQRYDDADLLSVEREVDLASAPGGGPFPWFAVILALIVLSGGVLFAVTRPKAAVVADEDQQLPEEITPFTTLGVLEDLRRSGRVGDDRRAQLDAEIVRIQRYYFGATESRNGDGEPDLLGIARTWLTVR